MRDFDLDQFWATSRPAPPRGTTDRAQDAVARVTAANQLRELLFERRHDTGTTDPSDLPPLRHVADEIARAIAPERARAHDDLDPAAPPPPKEAAFAPADNASPEWMGDAEHPREETYQREPFKPVPAEVSDDGFSPPPRASRLRRSLAPILWSSLGFVSGILAWHVVGFWTFVSDVVLNPGDKRQSEAAVPALVRAAERLTTGSISRADSEGARPVGQANTVSKLAGAADKPIAHEKCIAVALNRGGGEIVKGECEHDNAFRDAGFNRRRDRLTTRPRLQDPVAWGGTTAVVAGAAGDGEPAGNGTSANEVEAAPSNPQEAPAIDFGTLDAKDLQLDIRR